MELADTFNILASIFVSIGGAGAIIIGIASWLGKLWAERLMARTQSEYEKDIERYKNQLQILQEHSLRYSGEQFSLYTRLWHSLCDLKDAADILWESAIEDNLQRFSQQLEKTSKEIEKSFLFIEGTHYRELSRLMEEFNDYEFGKDSLIRLYEMRESSRRQVHPYEIENLINENRERKQRFESLIRDVGVDLKSQLRGYSSEY